MVVEELDSWSYFFIKNVPGRIGRLIRYIYLRLRLKKSGIKLSVCEGVEFRGTENISLGKYNYFVEGSVISACDNGKVNIGNYFAINGNSRIIADNNGTICIGDHVMIGPNVTIRASNHETGKTDIPIWFQGQTGGEINIKDDVWIGANVVILPGVNIASHSIIAAGALVNKDVEAYGVYGGVPAKKISNRKSDN